MRINFVNTKLSLNRSIWSYSKIQHLVAALIRGRKAFMNQKTPGLILDIGCGPNSHDENINLDYSWRPGVDVCCDITRGLPFPDQYVGGIFSEHCIEHISLRQAFGVFREMHRILRPNGHVRIVVPDLEIYISKYKTKQPMPYANLDVTADLYTPAMSINRIINEHGHQFIYDFETLQTLLEACGFADVNKCEFAQGKDRALLLDSPAREMESLYVEARKTGL
ncbi:MAG TPA: methyltransferase domain-containing protein [Xanthobacteraceae bacterium]|jgi:predicted SAM-dependent methyltransferase|nr:methyltransferase domain-containing protein [Xanthobacteraceae bacterium]